MRGVGRLISRMKKSCLDTSHLTLATQALKLIKGQLLCKGPLPVIPSYQSPWEQCGLSKIRLCVGPGHLHLLCCIREAYSGPKRKNHIIPYQANASTAQRPSLPQEFRIPGLACDNGLPTSRNGLKKGCNKIWSSRTTSKPCSLMGVPIPHV